MPDKYGFNQLGAEVKCIDCEVGGPMYLWKPERREVHFYTHSLRIDGENLVFDGETSVRNCRVCNREFEIERKRGRPRVLCYVCKPL